MRRLSLGGALAALVLVPAGALAGTPRATVFSVDKRQHSVQVVDAGHLVHAYRYRGKLPRLNLGDRISFRRSGHTISHVARAARASATVSFYAQVVRSSAGRVQLRLSDGDAFSLSSKQVSAKGAAHAAAVGRAVLTRAASAPVTVLIHGLTPGVVVLIAEAVDAHGHWTVTITLPPPATSGATIASGDDPTADDQVTEGRITQVSASLLAIDTGSGEESFAVDPTSTLTDGFVVGDVVAVTSAQNADGSPWADDVEYVEDDASGVVTAVGDGSITLDEGAGGPSQTISADPASGLFTGVMAGDSVDVTYHESAGAAVADALDDQSWDS
ncbi:MAG TPA: hypothetical protein VGH67_20445 [Solirubrobacteraceae bacterium]